MEKVRWLYLNDMIMRRLKKIVQIVVGENLKQQKIQESYFATDWNYISHYLSSISLGVYYFVTICSWGF